MDAHTDQDQKHVMSNRTLTLLSEAARSYQNSLRSSKGAVSYLRGRGITGAGAARYGVGFAAARWHGLEPILSQYDTDTVEASGLQIVKWGDQERRFDRFRDRVMFPIRDVSGQVCGFGGRVLAESDHQPKYLNSPEGPTFKKRELLYGLYEAQKAIEQEDIAVIVEGYLDVVSLAQAGFLPVVGSLGTSCTADQIGALLTRANRLVFAFDGDTAGRRAANAALATVLPFAFDGTHIEFLFLPEEHDPDSFVRAHGLAGFKAALDGALCLGKHIQHVISQGCNFEHAEGRVLCAARAREYWLTLPDGKYRQELMAFCCSVTRITEDGLLALWKVGKK